MVKLFCYPGLTNNPVDTPHPLHDRTLLAHLGEKNNIFGKPEKRMSGKFLFKLGVLQTPFRYSLSMIIIGRLNRTTGYEGLIALEFGRGEDLR